MKIRFLQVAIAQWEHNNKLKGTFHCTIGINLDTYELTRMYPVEMYKMQKHGIYLVDVEPMTCRRENSFRPLKIKQIGLYKLEQTQIILNQLNLTSIDTLNVLAQVLKYIPYTLPNVVFLNLVLMSLL
jgi:hypothetical protein